MAAARLRDISNADFDPFVYKNAAFGDISDPWPIITAKRHQNPVSPGEYRTFFGAQPDPALRHLDHYTVWGYDVACQVLSDPELFSSAIVHKIIVEPAFGKMLVVMDPPEHEQYRRFMQKILSPKNVRGWHDEVVLPTIHRLIDRFADSQEAELVEQFTERYPFDIAHQLLGLPEEERLLFQKLASSQIFALTEHANDAIESGENLADYIRTLIKERRKAPSTDVVSQLATVEIDGERPDDEIIVAFVRHFLSASSDTSYRTTGSLLVSLLSDPALLAEVRADPKLIPLAIEETLRWDGPVAVNIRTLTRDIELAGVAMKAGSVIHVAQGSANRDETRFEEPDRFDLRRSRKYPHLGFGGGPHQCVGMQLARIQIREAIFALLERFPNLRAHRTKEPMAIKGYLFRGPPTLHVELR